MTRLFLKLWRFTQSRVDEPGHLFWRLYLCADFIIAMIVHGCGINEYFQYNFYNKRYRERRRFICYRQRMKLVDSLNAAEEVQMFDDKALFNQKFERWIKRAWMRIDHAAFDEFHAFYLHHGEILLKPADQSGGRGLSYLPRGMEYNQVQGVFEKLYNCPYLAEEILPQHDEMRKFHPESINSLRIVTLKNSRTPKAVIGAAVFRCGVGSNKADNFHHDGLAATIDLETGIVKTTAIDKKGQRYLLHPDTLCPIVGFQIPNWASIADQIVSIATESANIGYVGWDIAVLPDGQIALIEGNAKADPDVTQMPDQTGKWKIFKMYLP